MTVRCEAGHVEADHLILACNGYHGGLDRAVAARVMPINNFVVATEPLGARAAEVLTEDVGVSDDRFVVNYFRLSHDGRLLFGGGESYGYRFPEDIRAKVRKPMLKVFPHLRDVALDFAWGGTLAITMKRLPHLARLAPNMLTASGYSGHGVGNAVQAGRLLAEAVRGQSAGFDAFAALPCPPFPGAGFGRTPLLSLAMSWFALRDRLGVLTVPPRIPEPKTRCPRLSLGCHACHGLSFPKSRFQESRICCPTCTMPSPFPESARAEIDRLLLSGDLFRYTAPQDSPVALLEREFATLMGTRYALAVSSCSAALFLSLEALDLPRDARVMIPGFTFAAVPSSVIHARCIPVLCEVGENYRIDMDDFAAKLPGCAAVIVSHMRGHTSDMDAILALCEAQGVPVIEDAAHSLGTTWHGRRIGTLGRVGCFSFQSYKLVNAGEGGILVTDDADLVARAVILSGAYEHNWRKHMGGADPALEAAFARHQNHLPLYNLRLSNLSAAVIRPQLAELDRRVRDGRRNHDHVAARLNLSPWMDVPDKLGPEQRAPDSLQFNLVAMSDAEVRGFAAAAEARGVKVQVFGLSTDNARAFWNWRFLPETPDLPRTRAMLMRACDTRLPARLTPADCDAVADALLAAASETMGPVRAYGT